MAVGESFIKTANNYEDSDSFLSEEELQKLGDRMNRLSPVELEELRGIIERGIITDSQRKLSKLLEEVNELNTSKGYENLREDFESKESLKRLFDVFDVYFNNKLKKVENNLNLKEKDQLKVVLFSKFQNLFTVKGQLGGVIKETLKVVKDGFNTVSNNDSSDEQGIGSKLEELYKNANKVIDDFGKDEQTKKGVLDYIDSKIGLDFDNLIKDKQEKGTIESIDYELLKTETKKIGSTFDKAKENGDNLMTLFKELPKGWGDKIRSFVSDIVKDYPILGALLSIVFGQGFLKEFLKGDNEKRKTSVSNLIKFSKKDKSLVKGLNEDYFKDFDTKKLDKFYSFLENNEIKAETYKEEGFWEKVINGATDDVKLLEVHELLKGKSKKVTFSSDELKGEGFVERLNGLGKLKADKESEVTTEEQKEASNKFESALLIREIPTEPKKEPSQKVKNEKQKNLTVVKEASNIGESSSSESSKKVTKITEQKVTTPTKQEQKEKSKDLIILGTKYRDTTIINAIDKAKTLPISVDYGKNKDQLEKLGIKVPDKIDFSNGELVVGSNEYKINFGEFTHDSRNFVTGVLDIKGLHLIGTPSIKGSDIILLCETEDLGGLVGVQKTDSPMKKKELNTLVLGLLNNGKYSGSIKATEDTSEIKFDVIELA